MLSNETACFPIVGDPIIVVNRSIRIFFVKAGIFEEGKCQTITGFTLPSQLDDLGAKVVPSSHLFDHLCVKRWLKHSADNRSQTS